MGEEWERLIGESVIEVNPCVCVLWGTLMMNAERDVMTGFQYLS